MVLICREGNVERGVWVGDNKIASIGIGIQRFTTSHGIGLNVSTDLSYFNHIVPCGLEGVKMTSMNKELNRECMLVLLVLMFSGYGGSKN